jgi:dihydrofolate reductase
MGKVVFDITMSLDGFICGPGDEPDVPLGVNGLRMHDWLSSDRTEVENEMLEQSVANLGAVICGRRTYDNSEKWWGPGQGPAGKKPVVVISHRDCPEGVAEPFTFTDSVDNAIKIAQEIAGDKDVCVMGGADIAQQFIKAGLIDEVSIHLIPVLFCGGRRLFDNLGDEHIEMEPIETIHSTTTTHLRYRVTK